MGQVPAHPLVAAMDMTDVQAAQLNTTTATPHDQELQDRHPQAMTRCETPVSGGQVEHIIRAARPSHNPGTCVPTTCTRESRHCVGVPQTHVGCELLLLVDV